MTAEEWRPVVGFPGYFVSDLGRVESRYRFAPRIMRTVLVDGYPRICLRLDGHRTFRFVHRLVAEAFHGPQPEGQEVRHLNGDRNDPRAVNLLWGTRAENNQDTIRHGRHANKRKTHCPSGHRYDETNTKVIPSRPNARYCRACDRVKQPARDRARRSLSAAA